jgi:predicted restriction endonuclease
MGNRIDDYAERFARLRTNRNRKLWTEVTVHQAPHRPILLLCVLDLFDSGEVSSNLIQITEDLTELFGRYWERILRSAVRAIWRCRSSTYVATGSGTCSRSTRTSV